MATSFRKRISLRSRVELDGFYNFSHEWYPCRLQDLSDEGAGLQIKQVFYPGDIIRLKFGLRSDLRVVNARVANVNGTRIGVRFVAEDGSADFVRSVITAYQRPATTRRFL